MAKQYVLHPAYVYSDDGDRHFITAGQLAHLYGVSWRECLVCRNDIDERMLKDKEGLIHLHVKRNGDYTLESR